MIRSLQYRRNQLAETADNAVGRLYRQPDHDRPKVKQPDMTAKRSKDASVICWLTPRACWIKQVLTASNGQHYETEVVAKAAVP